LSAVGGDSGPGEAIGQKSGDSGAGQRFIAGLRTGILVLIVPPMFMSVGITVLTCKKRNRCNDPKLQDRSSNDW